MLEFVLAVPQQFLDLENFGYFEVLAQGDEALSLPDELKIGKQIAVEGSLWSRRYKDLNQKWLREYKVILSSIRRTQ